MVICASCRRYADDSRSVCQHCGAPLEAHDRQEFTRLLGVQPEVAELAADQERARLVASGIVVRDLSSFFFDDGQQRTVLAHLFGSPRTPQRTGAALAFSAVAYLVQEGYCDLIFTTVERPMGWVQVRPWDGQLRSLEGMLARRATIDRSIDQALDAVIRDAMGFRVERAARPRVRVPGMPEPPLVWDRSERTALRGIVETSRRVVLPDHDPKRASAEIYDRLRSFVLASPERARSLAQEIRRILDWFAAYEQDPSIALLSES
jgi:hypothetical protein